MLIRVDHRNGRTYVDHGQGPVRLRPPTFRQWAEWTMEWETQADDLADAQVLVHPDTRAVLYVDGTEWEDHPAHPPVAALNREILMSLGAPINPTDPTWDLTLGDRMLTSQLLTFWRDRPLSPWDPDGIGAADRGDKNRRVIRSSTPGIRGAMSVVYRALDGHDPQTIDRLELWQIATLLGRDDPTRSADWDDEYHGARTRRNASGNREYMGFRRNPRQRYLFTRPAQVTMN